MRHAYGGEKRFPRNGKENSDSGSVWKTVPLSVSASSDSLANRGPL